MSLDTLLEAAKYLDHIEKRDLSDSEVKTEYQYVDSDSYHEDSEELIMPSATYHLKVDPNVPISVQFHTYTSTNGGIQSLPQPNHLWNTSNTSNTSTKRNAHQSGGNVIINNNSIIRPTIHKYINNNAINNTTIAINNDNNSNNNININNKNKDHSSYSRHREMHKTLEKNRRAHLRHCFEILKDELPPNEYNEKKSSHINIISCAIRYIQHLKRTECELEHETERLVRTKIRFQSQIAQLKDDLRDLNNKSDIEALIHMVSNNNTQRAHSLSPNILEYDGQSDDEVIIELEERYDDESESTNTASECADDIRDNTNTSKISGSLTNAIIYKCHA